MMNTENHFLHFTRKERMGMMFMIFLIMATMAASHLYGKYYKQDITIDDSVMKKFTILRSAIDTNHYVQRNDYSGGEKDIPVHAEQENTKPELFPFDPNTLSQVGWEKLGVNSKTAATIRKYISKGGKFYKPDDIKKIWGLQNTADRLIPFVKIPEQEKKWAMPSKPLMVNRSQHLIEINEADSLQWLSLPGIGPSFSRRIINFRKRLGGFYSIEQVSETFGLHDSVYKKIRSRLTLKDPFLKKIDLNTATYEELKAHPYLRYHLANIITQFRQQHGNFKSVSDLNKIMVITDSIFNKIKPYLEAF